MDFGLALLSRAAAGVRPIPSGASLINCLQLMVSRSISLPASDGTRGVFPSGVVSGSGSGSGSGAGAGAGAGCDWVGDSDAVGAGSGEMDGSGTDGGGSGELTGSDLTVDCLGAGVVALEIVVFVGFLVSA